MRQILGLWAAGLPGFAPFLNYTIPILRVFALLLL